MATIDDLKADLDEVKKALEEIKKLIGGGSTQANPIISPSGTYFRIRAGDLHPDVRSAIAPNNTQELLVIPLGRTNRTP